MPDDEHHCDETFRLSEGDTATFVMDDNAEVNVEVDDKTTLNDESGPNIIEQTTLHLTRVSDGTPLVASRTDGISGIPDTDPFPSFTPLIEDVLEEGGGEIPEEHLLGYVSEVRGPTSESGG